MLSRGLVRGAAVAAAGFALSAVGGVPALAATPDHGTLTLNSSGKGTVAWHGTVGSTATTLGGSPDLCFGSDRKPDTSSGCDFFVLNVDAAPAIVRNFIGSISVTAKNFG